jgi:GxxExxY protein
MSNLIYKEESYKILGACFEVYKEKGFGFTEPVYQECLEVEFELQGIPFVSQPKIQLEYKGRLLDQFFKPDFICFDKIIVEIKSVPNLIDENTSQVLNYLNATNFELAWLINFGHYPQIERKRFANDKTNEAKSSLREEINSWFEK